MSMDYLRALAALSGPQLLLCLELLAAWATLLTAGAYNLIAAPFLLAFAAGTALGVTLVYDGVGPCGATCVVAALSCALWRSAHVHEMDDTKRPTAARFPLDWLANVLVLLFTVGGVALFWHVETVLAARPWHGQLGLPTALVIMFATGLASVGGAYRAAWPRFAASARIWGVIALASFAIELAFSWWLTVR
jgi:hypothetical protein